MAQLAAELEQAPRGDWLRGLTIAHRGLHGASYLGAGQAENSLSAFATALRFGYAIEADLRLSADGQAMVFHDATLDRLTHVQGPLAAHPAAILQRIPLGATRDTIPSLAQLLAAVNGGVPLLLELKLEPGEPHAPLCAAVAAALAGYSGSVAVMSFDQRVPKWFSLEQPNLLRGLVVAARQMSGWRARSFTGWSMPRAAAEFLAVDLAGLPSPACARWRETRPVLAWTIRREIQRDLALAHADGLIVEADGFP